MNAKRVLVIEDNSLNMKLVRVLLAAIGKHKVIEAFDAESGIQLAREQQPDLILMDIQLPNMDGLDATRIIKADPTLKKIAIIALTSRAMEGDERRAKEAGCNDYISKPIDTKLFLKTVGQYLTV
jgi:CheY-like chemotaxis protein